MKYKISEMKRVAPDVYKRPDGAFHAIARRKYKGRRDRTFPKGTKLGEIIAWQEQQRDELVKESKPKRRGSLKFCDLVAHYQRSCDEDPTVKGKHAYGYYVRRLNAELGDVSCRLPDDPNESLPPIVERFEAFIIREQSGYRKVWKNGADGTLRLENVSTKRRISEETIKSYKRQIKAICGRAVGPRVSLDVRMPYNPFAGMKIGKCMHRNRPVTEEERAEYLSKCDEYYPWFRVVVDFARHMPIRHEDICRMEWSMVDEINRLVPYLPEKNRGTGKSNKWAYPYLLDFMMDHYRARKQDLDCPFLFVRPENGGHVPLTYSRIRQTHNRICRAAGIVDFQFYDWRHDAVNFLRSIGYTIEDIMTFGGWSTPEMPRGYDTQDAHRHSRRAKAIFDQAEKKFSNIVSFPNAAEV